MVVKRGKKEYSIQAVTNSLNVLEQFRGEKSEIGVTELSKNLGLHKNNIFRLLATLESRGYIEQDLNTGNYRLGTAILELSFAYLKHTGLLRVAKPIMERFVSEINENAYLGLLRHNQVVYVEHVESNHILRVSSRIGYHLSPLCTAVGKIILAHLTDEERDRVLSTNKFVAQTKNTITSKEDYLKELERTLEVGYAIDNEEFDEGVTCIAAPILNYEKRVIAGLSVSGPTSRLNPERLQQKIVPALLEASYQISKAIGYLGTRPAWNADSNVSKRS